MLSAKNFEALVFIQFAISYSFNFENSVGQLKVDSNELTGFMSNFIFERTGDKIASSFYSFALFNIIYLIQEAHEKKMIKSTKKEVKIINKILKKITFLL